MKSCSSEKKRFIESSSFYTNCTATDPFIDMKIDDSNFLDEAPSRSSCPKCHRSRKYYCYTCYIPVKEISNRIPIVDLPIKIDIIKHPREVDGKSTSAHAAVLAPKNVKIYTYPDVPSYENEKVVLIFPGNSAVTFKEWWHLQTLQESNEVNSDYCKGNSDTKHQIVPSNPEISRVIFIDSTWRQSKALYNDPRLKNLPCVILSSYKSLFWRYQRGKPDTYLATVEAVYYFLRDFHAVIHPTEQYDGQFDNMLFFFKFMYCKLRNVYDVPCISF